jgi:hypothetical protein
MRLVLSRIALAAPFALAACGAEPPAIPPPATPPAAPVFTLPATAPPRTAATSVRRVVVSLTRPSGTDVMTTASDGTITSALDVLENGRGAHIDATIRLAPDGTLASFDAHGHHTFGTPVDETFTLDSGHAHWKSHEENGDRAVSGSTFFVPVCETMDTLGMLAVAALKAGGTIALLPDGQAHIARTGDATVTVHGQSKHLVAYDIVGLDLTPTPVWMEDDGTWFGYVEPWFSVIPEGWESVINPLVAKQQELVRARDLANAKRLAHTPPAAGLALTHARVLDVARGKWMADQTVIVVGDTIRAVGPFATTKIPAGAETMDLAGKALLPGLWDMHAHLGDADGALDVASGVTTVRDVGNDPDQLDDYKKRFDDGSAIGPHVYRMGFIEGRGAKAASSAVTAETEAEAKAGVEFFAKRHYDGMKIYNSMKPELVPVITREAHARGMSVTGHIPVHMLANEAVRAGYDGIEHVNQLLLNFFADHDTDTRTITRFSIVGDKAADFDFNSKEAQDFFALLRAHHTVVDPTLATFEETYVFVPGKIAPGYEPIVSRLPVQTQRAFLAGGIPMVGKEDLYRRSFDKMTAVARVLREQKIQVVAGTDALAGLMLDRELELFVKGGIAPIDAIRMATIEPARVMKADKKTGSVTVGKTADLFVVSGDPLARIDDVADVVTTLRGGIVFPSKELFQTVGVQPAPGPQLTQAATPPKSQN